MLGGLSSLVLVSKSQRRIALITTQITCPTTVMMVSRMNSTKRMMIRSMRLQSLRRAGDTQGRSGIQTTPNKPKQQ